MENIPRKSSNNSEFVTPNEAAVVCVVSTECIFDGVEMKIKAGK